jgi:hypothetical protein
VGETLALEGDEVGCWSFHKQAKHTGGVIMATPVFYLL